MKTLNNSVYLLPTVALPILIFSSWLYFSFTHSGSILLQSNIIFLLACCLFFITSKKTPRHHMNVSKPAPLINTVLKVWSYQIISIIIFLGFMKIVFGMRSQPIGLSLPILQSPLKYGLFPWSAYTIICVGLLKKLHKQHSPLRLNDLIIHSNTKKNSATTTFWISLFTNLTATAIAFCLSLTCIYLAHCIFPSVKTIHAGWYPEAIVCAVIVSYINYVIVRSQLLDRMAIKKIPLTTFLILLTLIISTLIGFIYAVILLFKPPTITTPHVLTMMSSLSEQQITSISCLTWWIIWLPISVPILSKICCRISIRRTVVILLSLPLIMQCLHTYHPPLTFYRSVTTSTWITPLAITAFFLVILYCNTQDNKNILTFNQLPIPKPNKQRSHTRIVKQITYLFLSFLTLLLLTGNLLTNIPLLGLSLATLVYTIIATGHMMIRETQPKSTPQTEHQNSV
jgi:hypothetical protein